MDQAELDNIMLQIKTNAGAVQKRYEQMAETDLKNFGQYKWFPGHQDWRSKYKNKVTVQDGSTDNDPLGLFRK